MRIQRRGDNAHDWRLYHGQGSVGVEWYFKETTRLACSVMLYRLDPGAEEGQHFHLDGDAGSCTPNSSDEIYVVTSGEVVMTSGDDRAVLRSGDSLYAPAGTLHGVRNESSEPAELVLIFGPPGSHPRPQTGTESFGLSALS
ncbi:cupin domain-containing protein [Saccharopolyspora phatthalungensis]|uniref:Mannose-6-phosphate isomerase-like protein (Cupin superfamily) n=1 Tax=Saccharopolyspora phatthalungensis TaxID=664693 RepID=A0A840Q0P2_9PSEU|nr:cupin domain-containing protein [Saccharopolyspora phatthalungensis]MBB5153540.1 mannose-6-phosphate isomerase-like protein (cupin superfamily) [Saccharopolyspora phatthalungensis]